MSLGLAEKRSYPNYVMLMDKIMKFGFGLEKPKNLHIQDFVVTFLVRNLQV